MSLGLAALGGYGTRVRMSTQSFVVKERVRSCGTRYGYSAILELAYGYARWNLSVGS